VKLIVGLGNPGRQYSMHRHNIGFAVVDKIAEKHGIAVEKRAFGALTGKGEIEGIDAMLAKPQTFMNLSGDAVVPLFGYYKFGVDDLVVIHDDVDIALGEMKLAKGAGPGGHNGVKSIIDTLGDNGFYRIRLGVGRPPEFMDTADYVLTPFTEEEEKVKDQLIENAVSALEMLLTKGLSFAQGRYH
jgi:PTH1 family peptidyl-tRNA hydrolase